MTVPYWFTHTMTRSALRVWMDLEVVNPEKRIESGPAIIAANHASYLDPPVVACAYRCALSFLARNTLFTGFFSWLLPKLNAVPIDRESADLKSMKSILRQLRDGNRLLMFPEGTRTHDGSLQESKAGIGMLVAKSRVPVQPVRVLGTFEAWPRSGKLKTGKITVIIGDPVEFSEEELQDKTREGYQRIANRLMRAIADLAPESN